MEALISNAYTASGQLNMNEATLSNYKVQDMQIK